MEFADDGGIDDPYNTGPLHSGVLGLHLGHDFGAVYAGGFAGYGLFDGTSFNGDSAEKPQIGTLAGGEIVYAASPKLSLTGQLGWAVAIGAENDTEYEGYFVHLGADAQINDRLTARFGLDSGRSEQCFVDCGVQDQPGEFAAVSLGADFALNDKVTLTGAVDYMHIEDYDDEDHGEDLSVSFGAKLALGPKPDHRRPTTPIAVFRAAGWMQPLD